MKLKKRKVAGTNHQSVQQFLGRVSKMFVDAIHILFPASNAMHGKFPAPICCRDSENVYACTICKKVNYIPRTSTFQL